MPARPAPLTRLTAMTGSVRRAVLRRRRPLAAALAGIAVASGVHAAVAPPPPRVPLLVAARDLPAGIVLASGDLTEVALSPDVVPDDVAPAPVGRVLAAPLRRGEAVTDVRLVGPGLAEGYPDVTAVPVRLPDAAMVDLLRVGDRVDLLATDPQGGGASVVATGVPVLAIPRPSRDGEGSGLSGRLVVVGADEGEVTRIADAAVRYFLTFAFAR
ncbi:MAG TPA: SAF domain-containing protein [Nocardioides sp.]|nr:SAF domain-containing protein [Nocardioides sp.]